MSRTITLATGYEPGQTVELTLEQFTRGWFTIDAVQLTTNNLWAVYEWADSKPFYGPKPDGWTDPTPPITGLTVCTPTGRVKAEFGDWVYLTPGGDFKTYDDAEFRKNFHRAEEPTR
jgi:hypothetical protein